ncbi:MAG: hypothetical protein HDR01_06105 [Lachnospiraceae bacterium]|nr:hypothetical protein [Lachnospiraceae bacterium]
MKQEKSGEEKKKRNQNRILFVGIFFCMMLVVAFFSACNAVKKYSDSGKEEMTESPDSSWKEPSEGLVDSQEEAVIKGNKNSMERYLEVKDPEKITKEHTTEALCYSRELSEEELVRYQEFLDRYEEDELDSEEEIEIIDRLEESEKEVEHPVFEIWNQEFFLPERTLTDEELLQMVDFQYKLSYAQMQRNEEMRKAAENSQDKVEENEVMEIAGQVIEKMFGNDVSSMDKEVQFNGVDSYLVFLRKKSEATNYYTVMIDMGTGKIEWVRDNTNEFGLENAVEINQEFEELCVANYQKAKTILTDILGADTELIGSGYQYKTEKKGKEIPKGEAGIIHYYFQMGDETVYHMRYEIEKKGFYELSVEEKKYSAYHTREEMEKEGAEMDGEKFIVPLTGAEKEVSRNENLQWIVIPME